jgi:hypothetical protein
MDIYKIAMTKSNSEFLSFITSCGTKTNNNVTIDAKLENDSLTIEHCALSLEALSTGP